MTKFRKGNSTQVRKRRVALYALQEGRCFWCDRPMTPEEGTLDELMPRARGGTRRWDNVVMACRPCNMHRADSVAPKWAFYIVQLREAWAGR